MAEVNLRPAPGNDPDAQFVEADLAPQGIPSDPSAQAILALTMKMEELRGTLKWGGGLAAIALLVLAFKH